MAASSSIRIGGRGPRIKLRASTRKTPLRLRVSHQRPEWSPPAKDGDEPAERGKRRDED
jgi:hypothetical protein